MNLDAGAAWAEVLLSEAKQQRQTETETETEGEMFAQAHVARL
jgi:hypothetical protein